MARQGKIQIFPSTFLNVEIGASAVLCLLALICTACTTNFSRNSGAKNSSSSSGNPISTSSSIIVLTKVMSSMNGSGSLDLIGDGSGSIGSYCSSEDSGTPKCSCNFSFIDSAHNSRSEPVTPHYVEADMLRCSTAVVPANIPYYYIKIMLNSFNEATSNEIKITAGISGLDPVDPATFVKVERYQCRRIETIPHLFEATIYDPVQSDDPKISFPRNFYTSNFGRAYSVFASRKLPNWNCPSNPSASNLQAGIDLAVYSIAPDALGSIRIFPPQGSENDRSTFYLAKAKTGIFTIPVNAYLAPETITPYGGPPMGYGASPIPTSNGESCPDTGNNIPPGYKWVKVWLFRKAFETPKYPRSAAILEVQNIACNPGLANPADPNSSILDDCRGLPAIGVPNTLAARAIWSRTTAGSRGLCVKFAALSATDACASRLAPGCSTQSSTNQFANYGSFGLGTDIWEPSRVTGSCVPGSTDYPLNLCELNAAGTAPRGVPFDSNLSYQDVPNVSDLGQTDYLFVVTPPTVMTTTMQNSSIADADVYTPYRFLPGDCLSPDPLNPQFPGDCAPSKRVIYGLKLHDVGENSDPNSEDPNRPGVFPVCALQPE